MKSRKGYLNQDVIDILMSKDKEGKTLKKYHYHQEPVDFVEVLNDSVKNHIKEEKRLAKLMKKGKKPRRTAKR